MSSKIFIVGSDKLAPLRKLVHAQHASLDKLEPECLLLAEEPLPHSLGERKRTYLGLPIDPIVISGIGFKPYPHLQPEFTLSLRWDGKWDEQLLCAFPIYGTANGNLGAQELVGWGARYVNWSELRVMFESNKVTKLLEQLNHSGFVSCGLSLGNGMLHVCSMWLGLPPLLIWHALEGVRGDVRKFFGSPLTRLYESWSVGTTVFSSNGGLAQYRVGASERLPVADRILSEQCGLVELPQKYFRTDSAHWVRAAWKRLRPTILGTR